MSRAVFGGCSDYGNSFYTVYFCLNILILLLHVLYCSVKLLSLSSFFETCLFYFIYFLGLQKVKNHVASVLNLKTNMGNSNSMFHAFLSFNTGNVDKLTFQIFKPSSR